MRLVWLIGAPSQIQAQLEQALSLERMGVPYRVHRAERVSEIPQDQDANPSVIVLMDTFAAEEKGFEGARALRERGFQGSIFLFGEPALEESSEAFESIGISGYFPPFERMDGFFLAGFLGSCVEYEGQIEIQKFIAPGGRSSFETIRSLKDFNAFSSRFAAFVGRFGVDLQKLKKVLMALSLSHVKTDTGHPTIEQPFVIAYGMDPKKIVLTAQTYSRGAPWESLRQSFTAAVSGMRSEKPLAGTLFPEFTHLVKAAGNLMILSGSSKASMPSTVLDPLTLITSLFFSAKEKEVQQQTQPYFFSLVRVRPGLEVLELNEAPEAEMPSSEEPIANPVEAIATEELLGESLGEVAEPVKSPDALLESSDLDDLLAEPEIMGDEPVKLPEAVTESQGENEDDLLSEFSEEENTSELALEEEEQGEDSESLESSTSSTELQRKLEETLAECDRLRRVSEAMAEDIKRLMRERRQPTTDRELKDSNKRLQEQVKLLTGEKVKALEMVATREKQIELMKAQIETLKKEKAA